MSRAGLSSLWLALRSLLLEFLAPLGVALGVGALVVAAIPASWNAPGLPYLLGYGKNVEALALAAGIFAAILARFAIASRPGRWAVIFAGIAGCVATLPHLEGRALLPAAPHLGAVLLLLVAWSVAWRNETAALTPPTDRIASAVAAPLLLCLAAVEGLLACRDLDLDVFHHGEVLASATDWLAGGRPFESFIWPHGLHDTGLAAFWIRATGKVGTSPVALAMATTAALGIPAAYLLARRLRASRAEGLAVAAALVLWPLLLGPPEAALGSPALERLGVLLFVILGFAAIEPTQRRRLLLSGLLFGVGFLFRFEAAIYGLAAAAAEIGVVHVIRADSPWRKRVRSTAVSGAWLLTGFAGSLFASHLIWGSPNAAWLRYLFGDLAHHHRDAVGLVLRWPLRALAGGSEDPVVLARGLVWFLFVAGLALIATAAVVDRRRGSTGEAVPVGEITFLAAFAILSSRSGLDRIDWAHVTYWAALPVLGFLVLLATRLRAAIGWSAGRSALLLALLLGFFDLASLRPVEDGPVRLWQVASRLQHAWQRASEHLAANPPAGSCDERAFTPFELRRTGNREFVRAACDAEQVLARHGVRSLAISDSAPWYWVRFGMKVPYPEFTLSRAYTPVEQDRWVARQQSRPLDALLLPLGYHALREYDVPGALRVPVIEAYLRARRTGLVPTPLPIGDLYLWNAPAACEASDKEPAPDIDVEMTVERAYFQVESGLLFAAGRASARASAAPISSLKLSPTAGLRLGAIDYGLRTAAGTSEVADGRELFALVAGPDLPAALGFEARLADGRRVVDSFAIPQARRLGHLRGAVWRPLAERIARSWALGLADRALVTSSNCLP